MKILLGMPHTGRIPSQTVISLLETVEKGYVEPLMIGGSLIYTARDSIVQFAVDKDYDYVLFVDSDMVFSKKNLMDLVAHDADICTGLYVTRDGRNKNVAYKEIITRRRFPYRAPKLIEDTATTGYASVSACGFGFCLIKTSVLKCMAKKFKSLFEPFKGVGEDVAFCIRARSMGYTINIDRNVKLGHVGEIVYDYSKTV